MDQSFLSKQYEKDIGLSSKCRIQHLLESTSWPRPAEQVRTAEVYEELLHAADTADWEPELRSVAPRSLFT